MSNGKWINGKYVGNPNTNTPQGIQIPHYEVIQCTLKEKLIGTGSKNLQELEIIINNKCSQGFRLHSFSTASANSTGFGGGDRIQATMVFEKIV